MAWLASSMLLLQLVAPVEGVRAAADERTCGFTAMLSRPALLQPRPADNGPALDPWSDDDDGDDDPDKEDSSSSREAPVTAGPLAVPTVQVFAAAVSVPAIETRRSTHQIIYLLRNLRI